MEQIKQKLSEMRKALVAPVVAVLAAVLLKYGIDVDNDVLTIVVSAILTGGAVYGVKNEPREDV